MKNCKSILVADANGEFCTHLASELDSQPDMCVVGVANNGVDTKEQIEVLDPDVVLMDIVLPQLDGIGVLRSLNREKLRHQPIIVIISYFITEMLELHAASLGAHYFIVKPFEMGNLFELLRYHARLGSEPPAPDDLEARITQTLREMGVPSHIKGFPYAREAVALTLNHPESNSGITKFIYPQVAKAFATTPSRVERAIRHAIEVAWTRGDIGAHYDLFRNSVSGERGKPTNAEFIATLADHLVMQKRPAQPGAHAHQKPAEPFAVPYVSRVP